MIERHERATIYDFSSAFSFRLLRKTKRKKKKCFRKRRTGVRESRLRTRDRTIDINPRRAADEVVFISAGIFDI